ncbi:MAG: nucleoside deaminase [Bacteroidota bacterium]
MSSIKTLSILLFSILIVIACEDIPVEENLDDRKMVSLPFQEYSMKDDSIQIELDEIYTLLSYSIVHRDWQLGSVPRNERRGYNIGTVLVNGDQEAVHWGLNCINSMDNATQHGEVRAIMSYLDSLRSFNLKGFTLYTTLEPCAMCSGMATMTNIKRVVYGQKDVDFSGALDRLALDSKEVGGFGPYPRTVISDPAPTQYRTELDAAFEHFLETEEEKYLAKFLTSAPAKEIYANAEKAFLEYQISYPENQEKYEQAKRFLESINF